MAISDSFGDLGIVLYLLGNPTGVTYVDRRGVTVPAETLTTGFTPMQGALAQQTSLLYQGGATAISFWALVHLNTATSITVKVQALYGNDPDIDANWADIQIVNGLTGLVSNSFAFTSNGTYLLQTASAYTVGTLRVVAEAAGAGFTATDYVKIAARGGL